MKRQRSRVHTLDIEKQSLKRIQRPIEVNKKLQIKEIENVKMYLQKQRLQNIEKRKISYKRTLGENERERVKSEIIQTAKNVIDKINRIQKQRQFVSLRKLIKNQKATHSYQQRKIPRSHSPSKPKNIIINLQNTKYSVIANASHQLGFKIFDPYSSQISFLNWNIKWTDLPMGPQAVAKLNKNQKINYFIGISSLSRKNLLMLNLYTMKQICPYQYDFFPQTFQFPNDLNKIKKFYKENLKKSRKTTFIVKPQASCQGKGIYLCQDISSISNQSKSIVQQYIQAPMLFEGFKFDFRVYVLLKSVLPLEVYIYKEGLVRLTTEQYQKPNTYNLDNLFLHLTNYAINKQNPRYQFNKTVRDMSHGHKKSLAQFFKSLQKKGHNRFKIWSQIKKNVIKTIISVQPHLSYEYKKAQSKNQENSLCFQILGFDFMVDGKSKVFLLEVNQSPSFSTDSPLDFLVKSYLIKDTLKILIQGKQLSNQNNWKKGKYENEQNIKNILGNYQQIFPNKNELDQKQYQKLLLMSKSHYYNCGIYRSTQMVIETISREMINKLPELKVKINKGNQQLFDQSQRRYDNLEKKMNFINAEKIHRRHKTDSIVSQLNQQYLTLVRQEKQQQKDNGNCDEQSQNQNRSLSNIKIQSNINTKFIIEDKTKRKYVTDTVNAIKGPSLKGMRNSLVQNKEANIRENSLKKRHLNFNQQSYKDNFASDLDESDQEVQTTSQKEIQTGHDYSQEKSLISNIPYQKSLINDQRPIGSKILEGLSQKQDGISHQDSLPFSKYMRYLNPIIKISQQRELRDYMTLN